MFRRSRAAPLEWTDGESPPTAPVQPPAPFVKRYRTFCYRLLGARFDRNDTADTLAERLKQAGVDATPGMHRAVVTMTAVLSAPPAFAVSAVVFRFGFRSPSWLVFAAVIGAVTLGAVLGAFNYLLAARISNRKDELERELPFTLSELSVLASTGTSPIELIRRMARREHDPAMTSVFKRVIYKADVQGKDLITALAETAKEVPSTSLRESLWDLGNMIHQGSNLDEYLRTRSEDVLKLKRLLQREFIDRLITFVDMYASLVLVGVLMLAVGAFLLDAFGSTAFGLDANALLLLTAFGLVPLSVALTAILISVAYSKAE